MYRIIVERNCLTLRDWKGKILTTGLVGEKIAFEFSMEWEGLIKTAVFKDDSEVFTDVTIGNENIIQIPVEALRNPGSNLYLGVYGESEDGSIVIPTSYIALGNVAEGSKKTLRPPQPPTPDWTARVDRQLRQTADLSEEMQRKADAGEFNGESAYALAVRKGYAGTEEQWLTYVEANGKEAQAAADNAHTSEINAASHKDKAKAHADAAGESAATAENEACRAKTEADRAAEMLKSKSDMAYVNNAFAGAVKDTLSGPAVATDMVSPIEHTVLCKISGAADLSSVTVKRYGKNLLPFSFPRFPVGSKKTSKGITFEAVENGGVKITGTATGKGALVALASIDLGDTFISTTRGEEQSTNGLYTINKYLYYQPSNRTIFVNIYYDGAAPTFNEIIYPIVNKGKKLLVDSYIPAADGTVEGMTSLSPNMIILSDKPGVNIKAVYNADTKKYIDGKFAALQAAIVKNV